MGSSTETQASASPPNPLPYKALSRNKSVIPHSTEQQPSAPKNKLPSEPALNPNYCLPQSHNLEIRQISAFAQQEGSSAGQQSLRSKPRAGGQNGQSAFTLLKQPNLQSTLPGSASPEEAANSSSDWPSEDLDLEEVHRRFEAVFMDSEDRSRLFENHHPQTDY